MGFVAHLSDMGSKVHLVAHTDAEGLHERYRADQEPIKRRHLQIIWLLTTGRTAKFVAATTGYSPRWISVLVGRYNAAGGEGLGDQRHFNPGAGPRLDDAKIARLDQALDARPPDGGLWTGRLAGPPGVGPVYPYGVSRVVDLSFLAEVCSDRVIARLQTSGKRHGLPAN